MSLLRSFALTKCSVSIVDTSSGPCSSTARWTQIRRTSHLPVIPSTISLHQNIASITSGTVPNGRVLRQARRRLRPDSSRRPPVDSHRGVLRRAQGVRHENSRSVQDRVVWRRVYCVVQQDLLLFRCHR